MVRTGSAALLLVLVSVVVALAATLTLFTVAYDGTGTAVRVEWEVSSETDVTGFELTRKAAAETTYTPITTVAANGQRRYLYTDTNVYRMLPGSGTPANTSGSFTYRLTVRSPNGDQSYLTVLAGTPSAVQRSWGTIKSMFR